MILKVADNQEPVSWTAEAQNQIQVFRADMLTQKLLDEVKKVL